MAAGRFSSQFQPRRKKKIVFIHLFLVNNGDTKAEKIGARLPRYGGQCNTSKQDWQVQHLWCYIYIVMFVMHKSRKMVQCMFTTTQKHKYSKATTTMEYLGHTLWINTYININRINYENKSCTFTRLREFVRMNSWFQSHYRGEAGCQSLILKWE